MKNNSYIKYILISRVVISGIDLSDEHNNF